MEEQEDKPKRRIPLEYVALGGMLAVAAAGGLMFTGAYEHLLAVSVVKAAQCDRVTGDGCTPAQLRNVYHRPKVDQDRVDAIRGIDHPEAEDAIRANVRAFVLSKPTEPPSREAKDRAKARLAQQRAAELEKARRANAPLPPQLADGSVDLEPVDEDHDWTTVEPSTDWTEPPPPGAEDDGTADAAETSSKGEHAPPAKKAPKVARIGVDAVKVQESPEVIARKVGCATLRGSWWIGFWWM